MSGPRLLMICGDFPPALSGIGDYIDRLCGQLVRDGWDITLLTTAGESPEDSRRPFRVLRRMPDWGLRRRHELIELARGFDLVHMQYPSVKYGRGPGVNLIPLWLRLAGIPCVVTIHDFRVMRWRWRARVVPMLMSATALIHVDAGDAPFLRRWSPLRHAPLVHIPIASNTPVLPCDEDTRRLWRRELGAAEEEFLIAHFGILYPHKGLSELLDAVDSLRQEAHNARVMVVGDFDRDADYVAPLTDRIRASGAIWVRGADLEQVSRCLHAADAAALPFHSGASFNRSSMLACLQHGLPTVTTNGPATPPELKDVYDVLLVPVQDASALAGALRKLITDPQLRQELRHRAFRSTAPLSWQAVSRAHGDFYRTLLPTPTELPRENPQRA